MKSNRLMIVEDEVLVSKDISSRLIHMGYEVCCSAGKGSEAIKKALDHKPDLILMDIHLRDNIDGIEAAGIIHQSYDVPIIFCTAYSNTETLERAKITAPYGYILKPFDNRELEINIEIALYKHRAEKELRETQERLNTTLRNINEGVIATDTEGRAFLVNTVAESLVGLQVGETKGIPITQMLETKDFETGSQNLDLLDQVLTKGESIWNVRQYLVRRNGSEVPIEISANAIRANRNEIIGMVISIRDISQQINFERKIRHNAFFDSLTNLPNRTLFLDRVGHAISRAQQSRNYSFAVLFIDLDQFRVINEGLGHRAGDELIIDVSHRIGDTLNHADTLSRFSGDIFAVLLDNIKSIEDVMDTCNQIQNDFSTGFTVDHRAIDISSSMGIVLHKSSYLHAEDMMRDADTAMHRAKTQAKGAYVVFDHEMHNNALRYIEWREEMQKAIDNEAFEVYYQPIISPACAKVHSLEALLRWKSDKYGYVSPAEFIPIAEDAGLICAIGEWVMNSVCQQINTWQRDHNLKLKVAVNLSANQFEQESLPSQISEILAQHAVPAELFAVEVTEGVAMKNIDSSIKTLQELKSSGISISIDDFGTGYSSLAYLKQFPINTLKIDRSFVVDITHSSDDQAIAQAIIALGQKLQLNVLAEGIETKEQLEFLMNNGCELIQGHYFCKAMPPSEIPSYLQNDNLVDTITSSSVKQLAS